ncbi:MAG TPA: acetate/propionate family kinase [Candidatus Acidoferrales bacterium]|nr:acetate/propionate family kinase [Candidatus Acidoferrales bacterium]
MNILTLNAGSSSIKFALFESGCDQSLREGQISWADGNRDHAFLTITARGARSETSIVSVPHDAAAATRAIEAAVGPDPNQGSVAAVGHRVVHGGLEFRDSTLIVPPVKNAISRLGKLAPLHNPPALAAIEAAETVFQRTPQVAVFDTAFFKNLPPKEYLFPLPYDYYQRWGIRRFGFHGTSYAYCTLRAAEMLNHRPPSLNLVLCHLGGGCSAIAVRDGAAIATTFGYSPLDGLMMATRPGSLDPGVLLTLQSQHGLTLEQIEQALNSSSGLLGVSGVSSDFAELEKAAATGDQRALLAMEMFTDRVRKAVGGLAVTLGSLDALVFTDRVGESSSAMRAAVCEGLQMLGVRLDRQLNERCHPDADIATADSPARILVIHTREELMIAREASRVLTYGSTAA